MLMNWKRSVRLPVMCFACLLSLGAAKPEDAIMDRVERTVTLPEGASALSDYVRRYSYLGDRTVIGICILREMGQSGQDRSWVKPSRLPQISDGGCGVVTVFYDPRKKLPPETRCNMKI